MLRGELDTTNAEAMAVAVAELTAGGQQLIVDLEALDFIDCHAAAALLQVLDTAPGTGGGVLLAAPHGPVLRVLTLLGVPGVHASVDAAAASACGDAQRRGAGISRFRAAALFGAPYWMARSTVAPGSRADGRPGTLRWLRARTRQRG